ncbi:hypothetical protein GGS20DRAFT_497028 [Poronia punctata]|nr:hypothetical protein GGS20DRAFT_497028 [Poronia punctata]
MAAWDNNSDLKAALPDKSHGNETQGSGITADQTAPTGPQWEVKPSNYNYNEDNDGYTWDGSAEVYKWDGQEGDIGPALPKLELQLFGDPDSRDPRGIDFSTWVFLCLFLYNFLVMNIY